MIKKEQLNKKVESILKELAKEAEKDFLTADYDGDRGEIKVYCEMDKDGGSLIAEGEKVGFIEFGTGLTALKGAGSYGQGKGANPKGWVYYGVPGTNGKPLKRDPNLIRTHGNVPAGIMAKMPTKIMERLGK